jgi:hypothetical protein
VPLLFFFSHDSVASPVGASIGGQSLSTVLQYPKPGLRLRNNPGQEHVSYQPRAERFPIRATVRYRASGESAWSEGTTLNISRSGVFFRAEKEVDPKTILEMRILFPKEVVGEAPANVLCWGPVVRAVPPESPNGLPAVAVSILRYRFARDESEGGPRVPS